MQRIFTPYRKAILTSCLLVIVGIGILLRLHNISPFKVYPDSYQSLLTALNIKDYHSVVGFLGKDGMVYPDFFGWTRPFYPLLILAASMFFHTIASSAQYVAVLAGILALPLAFFLGRQVFKSFAVGVGSILLLTLSYNHTVWGGFILTETLAVFLMLLFLLSIFWRKNVSQRYMYLYDGVYGILLALLILTRYEYTLLILPFGYFLLASKQYSRLHLLSFGAAFLSTLFVAVVLLYPLPGSLFVLFAQAQGLLLKSILLIAVCVVGVSLFAIASSSIKGKLIELFRRGIPTILWIGAGVLLLQGLLPQVMHLGLLNAPGIQDFVKDDFLLVVFFLIGITIMLVRKSFSHIVFLILFSLVILLGVYVRVNPAMERYMTHLIPFLLIPASYGLSEVFRLLPGRSVLVRIVVIVCFSALLMLQGFMTFQGLRTRGDRSWFRVSYDEKAAALTSGYLHDPDTLLLASFPEPYYLVSRHSTYSLIDSYPFIYIPDSLNNRPILVSDDIGMLDLFPHFSQLLHRQLSSRVIATFPVNEVYHYREYTREEDIPVTLYLTTVGELKKKIHEATYP